MIASGFFWSCVPVPEENPEPGIPVNSMLVKKIVESEPDGTTFTTEYTYVGKKISEITESDGKRTEITYEGDLITKEEEFNATDILLTRTTYVYDISENLVSYVDVTFDNDGDANDDSSGERWVYVHNANGTISYEEFIGDATSQTTHYIDGTITTNQYIENNVDPITMVAQVFTDTFTFDTKHNPYVNVIGYDKIYFAASDSPLNFVNNELSQTDQIDSNAAYLLESTSYTYTANNFPLTETITDRNGEVTGTANYTYY